MIIVVIVVILWLFYDYFMVIDNYLWLVMIICNYLWLFVIIKIIITIVSVVCINTDIGQLFFREIFSTVNMINIKTMNE